jgi:hypothetical protein
VEDIRGPKLRWKISGAPYWMCVNCDVPVLHHALRSVASSKVVHLVVGLQWVNCVMGILVIKKTQKIRFWYFKCILKTKTFAQEAKLSAKDNM